VQEMGSEDNGMVESCRQRTTVDCVDLSMSGRVAVLAGAGGELGRVTAQKLFDAGFTVVGIDRNEDGLKQLPEGIRYEVGDPTDRAQAKAMVERIAVEVGAPDVLVNTVGTYHLGGALEATPEDLRLMIDVNAGTALWLTQAVAPYMQERGSGAIVHVAARPGLEPTPGMVTYSLSKAALVHLTRVLDLELRQFGIRVNAVAPQVIDTDKNRPYLPPEVLAHAVTPGAIADVIVYLLSDAAAPVSGAVVPAYGP
jgi:NAD(P)-dependent dehydrogenase (short-subunit alcohol dehydrogenase family)